MTAIQSLTYLWYRVLALYWALRGQEASTQHPRAARFEHYRQLMHQQYGGTAPKRPSWLARLRPGAIIAWARDWWGALLDRRKASAAMSTPVRYWTSDQCEAVRRELVRTLRTC